MADEDKTTSAGAAKATPAGDKKTSRRSTRKSTAARAVSRASRSNTSTSSGSGSVTAVVVSDSYAWHEVCNDPSTPRHDAAKGDKITVSAAEFKRSQDMSPKALAKAGSDQAKAAESGGDTSEEPPLTKPDGTPVDDDQQ